MTTTQSHIYADYLFTLYVNGSPISLDMLMSQTVTGTAISHESETPEQLIKSMEDRGLVEMGMENGSLYIGLTEYGEKMSVLAADVISERMMFEWQRTAMLQPA